jgi:hypothetical protein
MAGHGCGLQLHELHSESWEPRRCSKAVLTLGFATSFARFPYLYDLNENQVLSSKQRLLLPAILWPRQNIKLQDLTIWRTTRGSTASESTSAWAPQIFGPRIVEPMAGHGSENALSQDHGLG